MHMLEYDFQGINFQGIQEEISIKTAKFKNFLLYVYMCSMHDMHMIAVFINA